MSENVVAINRSVQLGDDRKQAFLDGVAAAFDNYVAKNGEAPDALVYVMGGTHQTARAGWEIRGPSSGAWASIASLAVLTLTKELCDQS